MISTSQERAALNLEIQRAHLESSQQDLMKLQRDENKFLVIKLNSSLKMHVEYVRVIKIISRGVSKCKLAFQLYNNVKTLDRERI